MAEDDVYAQALDQLRSSGGASEEPAGQGAGSDDDDAVPLARQGQPARYALDQARAENFLRHLFSHPLAREMAERRSSVLCAWLRLRWSGYRRRFGGEIVAIVVSGG
jgi:hypothetical protein